MASISADGLTLERLRTGTLGEHADVTAPTPASGDYLKWNGTAWINSAISGTTTALAALTDASISSPAAGQLLMFNGSVWVNTTTLTANLSVTATAGSVAQIEVRGNGLTAAHGLVIQSDTIGDAYFWNYANAAMYLGTNNVARVSISNTGTVVVYTGNLTVGTALVSNPYVTFLSATVSGGVGVFSPTPQFEVGTQSNHRLALVTNGSTQVIVSATGDLSVVNGYVTVANSYFFRCTRNTGGAAVNVLGYQTGTDNLLLTGLAGGNFRIVDTGVTDFFVLSAAGNFDFKAGTLTSTGALSVAAGTFTGLVLTPASATGTAGFRLPHGAAPTSPVNGDCWTTTSGLFLRLNGSTVGPFATGISGSGTTGKIVKWTTGGTVIGDSLMTETATTINVAGAMTVSTSSTAVGNAIFATKTVTASGNSGVGASVGASMTHTSGTSALGSGVFASVTGTGNGGTTTAVYAFQSDIEVFTGHTFTTAIGVYVPSPQVFGGTITTFYGIKIENTAGGTSYAIHTGTGLVHFGDHVDLASGKVYKVNGTQVVGAQGAAVADATGAGDVVAQLNALLARSRAHGLIA